MNRSHLKSIVKAFTWRAIAAIDTFVGVAVISWLATGEINLGVAGGFVGVEAVTKFVLYYSHERVWALDSLVSFFSD